MKLKSRPLLAASSFAVICVAMSSPIAQGANRIWVGGTSTDWNTASNWNAANVPTGSNPAIINITSPICTVAASNSPNIPTDIVIGSGTGVSGRLDHTAGTLSNTKWMKIGYDGGTGVYNLSGSGSFSGSTSAGIFRVGGGDGTGVGGGGTANVNTTGSISVWKAYIGAFGYTGTFNLTNATVNVTNFYVGDGYGTTGLNGVPSTSNGTLNMIGGTINGAFLSVGNSGGTGVLNLANTAGTGGALTGFGQGTGAITIVGKLSVGGGESLANYSTGGTGTLNMNTTGTLAASTGVYIGTLASTGVVNLDSGTISSGSAVYIGDGASTSGTLNMSGGTIKASAFTGGAGSATAHFNGGTLQATADSGSFISNLDDAVIQAGGALIDTQAFVVSTTQIFTGSGDIVKSGSGTLNLRGDSLDQLGNVIVNAGKLGIDNNKSGGINFTVANSARLSVLSLDDVTQRSMGVLTLGTGGTTTVDFDLGNFPGIGTAPIWATDLAVTGTVTVNITDPSIQLGHIPLIKYTNKTVNTGSFVIGSYPGGVNAVIVDDGAGLVYADVTDPALRWNATVDAIWDTGTANWTNGSPPNHYSDGADAKFDDTVSGATLGAVVLNSTVTPGSVTFDNPSKPYSITGTGKISGTTGLVKKNSGTLALETSNDYTGVTNLQGGTTSIKTLANAGNPSSIGAATAGSANLLFSGGNLTYTGTSTSTNRGFTLAAAGSTISTATDINISGQVASTGSSNLIKKGSGNLTFSGAAANVIGTTTKGLSVNNGTVTFSGVGTNNVFGELRVGDPTTASNSALVVTDSNLANTGVSSTAAAISIGAATGSTAIFTLNGASVVSPTGRTYVGREIGVGTLEIKDTSAYNTGSGNLYVANDLGSTGTVTISDSASLTLGVSGQLRIGEAGAGTFNQTGGTVSASGFISLGRNNSASSGMMTISGGTFTQETTDHQFRVGEKGAGTLTISGTGALVAKSAIGLYMTLEATSSGVINLDGGSITATAVLEGPDATPPAGTSTFNFNGGLLKAGASANPNFVTNIDTVNVKSGGARIDSNGNNIAVTTPLLDGGGGGGLTKSGAGALYLNATSSYTGTTALTAGTLGGTGSVAGPLTIAATTTLAPGVNAIATFGAGATTISGTYACEVSGVSSDLLVVNGALDVSAATLAVTELTPLSGPVVIATYTGATPAHFASISPALPAGYGVDYHYNGLNQIAITSSTPFQTWANANITAIDPLADATPGGDPDNDGQTNLAEFALNGDPLSGAASGKVVSKVVDVGGVPSLVLSIPVRGISAINPAFNGATEKISDLTDGIVYRAQGSIALASWTGTITEVTGGDKTTIESTLPSLDSGWFYRTFTTGPVSGAPKDFMRAVIEQP